MPAVTQTSPAGGAVTVSPSNTTTTIFNETILLADTEQSKALPANTKEFLVRTRSGEDLKIAYTAAGTTTDWVELEANAVYTDDAFYSAQTLFFQSPTIGAVVEIIAKV